MTDVGVSAYFLFHAELLGISLCYWLVTGTSPSHLAGINVNNTSGGRLHLEPFLASPAGSPEMPCWDVCVM